MQQITITGNLVADAEVKSRKSTNGEAASEFVSFKVACNNRLGEVTETTFYDVTYRKSNVLNYLKKGQSVLVSGTLRAVKTAGENGKEYYNLHIYNTHTVELTGKKTENN